MSKVRLTYRAREDLLDIWVWLATRTSEAVADRILDRIEERCRNFTEHPFLGPARTDIGEGARNLVIERWLVLYRVADDVVQIVRVVDGARDLTKIEWAPE